MEKIYSLPNGYERRTQNTFQDNECFKNGSWNERKRETEEKMAGLYEGGTVGSWCSGRGCAGQGKVEETDPHRRPQQWE